MGRAIRYYGVRRRPRDDAERRWCPRITQQHADEGECLHHHDEEVETVRTLARGLLLCRRRTVFMKTLSNFSTSPSAALGAGLSGSQADGTADELGRVLKELSLLVEISRTLDSSFELRDVVRPVLQRLAEGMGMKRGTITIVNRATRKISIEEAVGLSSAELQTHYLLSGNALIEKVIQTGQPLIVTDLTRDELFQEGLPPSAVEAARTGKRVSLICVPIQLGEEVIGTLSVEREAEDTQHLAADRRLLSMIAAMVAQAAHLRQTAQRRVEALEQENARLHEQIENHLQTVAHGGELERHAHGLSPHFAGGGQPHHGADPRRKRRRQGTRGRGDS